MSIFRLEMSGSSDSQGCSRRSGSSASMLDDDDANSAVGFAQAVPIDIQRPGLTRELSHATRHGLRAHLSDPIDMDRPMHGTKGPCHPTPYGNHKHRGPAPPRIDVPNLANLDDIAVGEQAESSFAHRFPHEVGFVGEAAQRTTIKPCDHWHHSKSSVGRPMGLPDSIVIDETKNWSCDLPDIPMKDRASEVGGPPVTVGVEWEFLVDPSAGPYGSFDGLPGDQYFVPSVNRAGSLDNQVHLYHISKALNDAGFLAATGPEVDYAFEKLGYAKARFPLVDHDLPFSERFKEYYIIRVDASVMDDGIKMPSEKWAPVEVASPVLTLAEMHKLDAAFGLLLSSFLIKTNTSYGLHVHVGNSNRGFSTEWMRTIAAMSWAIAPLFDAFHPPSRGPCNGYTRGIRYFAKVAHDGKTLGRIVDEMDPAIAGVEFIFPTAPGGTVAYPIPPVWPGRPEIGYGRGPQAMDPEAAAMPSEERIPAQIELILMRDNKCPKCPANPHMAWAGVKRLLESKSTPELLGMLTNAYGIGGRMNYNFNNLRYQGRADTKRPRTIEFRQHSGTTDLVAIKCWMRVCCAIVETCRPLRDPFGNGLTNNQVAVEVARRAVEGSLCLTHYDCYDFMADIGCHVAHQTYLRERKDEENAAGLLVALPRDDDVWGADDDQRRLQHLDAFRNLFRALKDAA